MPCNRNGALWAAPSCRSYLFSRCSADGACRACALALQANHRGEWMECLRRAFEELGGGGGGEGGRLRVDTLVEALADKLPEDEVRLGG
jgi:hypothetical protein